MLAECLHVQEFQRMGDLLLRCLSTSGRLARAFWPADSLDKACGRFGRVGKRRMVNVIPKIGQAGIGMARTSGHDLPAFRFELTPGNPSSVSSTRTPGGKVM